MLSLGLVLNKLEVDLSIKALMRKEERGLSESYRSVGMCALEVMAGFEHLSALWRERKFFTQEAWFNTEFKSMVSVKSYI